jgi:xanthine/CO dehydrogenase XdhC/CoxF family maturation factor
VKHWQETADILRQVAGLAERSARAAVATVVRIQGSAYRRQGAKFLVQEDGQTVGGVSGGCLEADVREIALAVIRDGAARLRHYDTGSDDRTVWGLGLGCNGAVDIFIQPASTPEGLRAGSRILELLAGDEAFAVATVLAGEAAGRTLVLTADGATFGSTADPALDRELASRAADLLRRGESSVDEIRSQQVFTEVQQPPPSLVVFGAGDDAAPLVDCARGAGFRVALVDHRAALLGGGRYPESVRVFERRPEEGLSGLPLGPRSFAVVKMHALAKDREWVRRLLSSPVDYIGVLGPRARIAEILRQLEAGSDRRVFGPVGLDLGADGPEQVALSIVAEMLAVQSSRAPRHLREREAPIHAP